MTTLEVTRTAPSDRATISAGRATVAGVLAAAVALAVTDVVSALKAGPSLIETIGTEFINRFAASLKQLAVSLFGTNDKPALVVGIIVVSLVIGGALGRASIARPWIGSVGFTAFGGRGDRDRRDRSAGGPLVDGRRRGARHRRRHRDVASSPSCRRAGRIGIRHGSHRPSRLSALLPRMECRSRRRDDSRRGSGSRPAGQVRVGHGGCRATRAGEDGASAAVATVHRSRPEPVRDAERGLLPDRHRAVRAPGQRGRLERGRSRDGRPPLRAHLRRAPRDADGRRARHDLVRLERSRRRSHRQRGVARRLAAHAAGASRSAARRDSDRRPVCRRLHRRLPNRARRSTGAPRSSPLG